MCEKQVYLDSIFTVTDPYGHDIKSNGFKTNIAFKFMLIIHNLITTNHRKEGKNEYDLMHTKYQKDHTKSEIS